MHQLDSHRCGGAALRSPSGVGNAGPQQPGVLLLGVIEHACVAAALDDAAAVEHDDIVGDLADHGEVVADQQVRDAGLLADVGEQVEDLGLDRDIERGDALVEDDQLRFGGEGAGDGDSLTLATGQGAGQRVELSGVEADHRAELVDPVCPIGLGDHRTMQAKHLVDGVESALARVEARIRVLEDDLDLAARAACVRHAMSTGRERS